MQARAPYVLHAFHALPMQPIPTADPSQSTPRNALRDAGAWVQAFVAIALLCHASLTVVRAPNTLTWKLAILATEFGHWLACGTALLLVLVLVLRRRLIIRPSRLDAGLRGITALLLLGSTGLYLSPTVRASIVARHLQSELPPLFPAPSDSPSQAHPAPFSLSRLWIGDGQTPPASPPERLFCKRTEEYELPLIFWRSDKASHAGPAPCVLLLHSGGWTGGSPEEFESFNTHLASRGYAVASLEYRLAPRWTWPSQREDVADALSYLYAHADQLGIDPERFILMGRSAGGQIAEAAAYGLHHRSIRGVIAFYAPADVLFARQYAVEDDVLNSLALLRSYLGGDPDTRAAAYESASAPLLVTAQSPPTLLVHGTRDELVWNLQSRRLHARLRENKVACFLLELPWATHAFDYNPRGPGGQLSTWAVERFLEHVTR